MAALKTAATLIAAAGLVLTSACGTSPNTGMRTTSCNAGALGSGAVPANGVIDSQIRGAFTPIPLDQIQILDPQLVPYVMIQSAGSTRTATQTLHVMARMVNCTNEPMQLEARTHFISASGGSAEPISAWKRIYVPQRALGVYEEYSVSTVLADKFLIEMRRAN
jgi:hypothetical protein